MQKEVFVVATFVLAVALVVSVYNISILRNQNSVLSERIVSLNQEVTKLQGQQTILENRLLVLETEKSQYDAVVRSYTFQIQDLLKKNEVLQLQLKSWDIPVIWVASEVQWTSSTFHPSDNVRISFSLTNTTNENAQNIRISLPESYMRGFQVVRVSDPRARLISNEITIDSLLPRETINFDVILRTQSPGLYSGPLRIRWTGVGDFFNLAELSTRVN
ncbi:MAG: hypothetical protein APG12_00654 [Candidatus Methanofastidiosum methylothiophilum]|uniref:Uncharacterized protein n=1 Tax=Candidatus Methanofastidiosum methylothiophilum TaxID=1705564 RepID=A0A150ISX2_9EURY|nr:MAG: hypothetical protein APG10_00047 [Candidatus Methanofastidiosum methylthiophilus]KYC48131.1 MAG: hypothetical protein APG11_00599 [Candidatus Methanofastidiosum methylthiophilus]KYC50630.1 MAG: hypothetical protein APG12_00654 [Candidatus Methanofastidiosum methylthiophilus]